MFFDAYVECLVPSHLFGKNENGFMQENIPLEEVFDNLKCTREGLTANEVRERLDLFGYNKLEEKKVGNEMLIIASFLICVLCDF